MFDRCTPSHPNPKTIKLTQHLEIDDLLFFLLYKLSASIFYIRGNVRIFYVANAFDSEA
jgi:hypothetical protein